MVIWWGLALGVATGVLPVSRLPRSAVIVLAALAALTAFTALSIWWAHDDGAAFADTVRTTALLGLFAACLFAARPNSIRSWTDGLCIALGGIVVIAFAARTIPGLSTDQGIALFLPDAAGRMSFPIGYWNALAGIIAMALPLLLQRAVNSPARLGRAAAAGLLPIAIVCLYLTASRGGMLAGALALGLVVVLGQEKREMAVVLLAGVLAGGGLIVAAEGFAAFRLAEPSELGDAQGAIMLALALIAGGALAALALHRDRWAPRLRAISLPRRTLAVAGVVALVLAVVAVDPAKRWDELRQPAVFTEQESAPRSALLSGTGNGRYEFWRAAADAFGEEPLRGIGAGGFEGWFAHMGSIYYPVKDAHSQPLEILAELGAIGFALVLVAFGAVVIAAVRLWRRDDARGDVAALGGLLLAAVIAASVDWSWEIPAFAFPVLVAVAILVGPAASPPSPPAEPAAAPVRTRVVAAVAFIAIAGLAIWACSTSFLYSQRLEGSRSAAGAGDLAAAEERARDAIEVEPWATEARAQLALVLERRGDLIGALAAIDSANRANPWDGRLWFLRARISLFAGNLEDARHALESARALRPRDPIFGIE